MFKIIIATHGEMSTGIKDAVETIAGIGEDISTLNLISGKDVNDLGREYLELLESPVLPLYDAPSQTADNRQRSTKYVDCLLPAVN